MKKQLSKQDQLFMQENAQKAATLLRTIGNHQRLLILCLLLEYGEMHVGEILNNVNLSQSALSQHLAKMREAGLITFRRESQTIFYRINDPAVEKIVATLKAIFCP